MEEAKMREEIGKLKQKSQLNRRERRYLAKLEMKLKPASQSINLNWKKIMTKIVTLLLAVIFIGAIILFIRSQPKQPRLPPIIMEGHIEQNPPAHILTDEMPESVQKHMLEHADGEGDPGIIIQYNCFKKFYCGDDLIRELEAIVKKYPKNVYLAPGDYDGKIILTKLGKREILDKFDKGKIMNFIENK